MWEEFENLTHCLPVKIDWSKMVQPLHKLNEAALRVLSK